LINSHLHKSAAEAGKVRKWKSVFFVMVNTSRKNLLLMSLCHCVQKNANKVSMSIKKQYGIGFIQVQSQINSGGSREGEEMDKTELIERIAYELAHSGIYE